MLKKLIQKLLDSRTTKAEAANASIPLYSETSQRVQETKKDDSFSAIAPYDCFVTVNAKGAQTSSSGQCGVGIKVNGINIDRSNMHFISGSVWFDRGAFIKKGDTVTASFVPWSENIDGTQFTVQFHKLIGGGKIYQKIFHSRRGLCLRIFLLSCWKNLSTPNVFGLQKRPCQQQLRAQSTSLQRSQATGLASRLPFPGIFVSVLSPQVCCLVMGFYGKVRMMTLPTIKDLLYLATRAAKLRICCRSTPRMRMCSSQRTWRIQCDLKGGAL